MVAALLLPNAVHAAAPCPPGNYAIADSGPPTLYNANEGSPGMFVRLDFSGCCCLAPPLISDTYTFTISSNNSALLPPLVVNLAGNYPTMGMFLDIFVPVSNDSIAYQDQGLTIAFSDLTKTSPGPVPCTCSNPNVPLRYAIYRDNDQAGVQVTRSPAGPCVTREDNPSFLPNNISIVLTSQPALAEDVTLMLTSSSPELGLKGTGLPLAVHFNSATWSIRQTFSIISAVQDLIAETNETAQILLSPANGDTPTRTYINVAPSIVSVTCTMTDDDTPGVSISPSGTLIVSEAGPSSVTVHVQLATTPTAPVNLTLSLNDTTEATVPSVLTLLPTDFGGRDFTVTGVDDAYADGAGLSLLSLNLSSADPMYNSRDLLPFTSMRVTTLDNDVAGFVLGALSSTTVTEAGGTASFQISLSSAPYATVSLAVALNDTSELRIVSGGWLVFSPANYSVPVTVLVAGVDDLIDDGNVFSALSLQPAVSADPAYNGARPSPFTFAILTLDDDTASIAVGPMDIVLFDEGSPPLRVGTFTVSLGCQPTGNVLVPFNMSSLSPGGYPPGWTAAEQLLASTQTLVFTPATWAVPQPVVLTAINDRVADGAAIVNITFARALTADPAYLGLLPAPRANQAFLVQDDDAPAILLTSNGTVVHEGGGPLALSVSLGSQPLVPVTVLLSLSPAATADAHFPSGANTANLTFTAANWNVSQTLLIIAVDDLLYDGDAALTVSAIGAASSGDSKYAGLAAPGPPLAVSAVDNEVQTTVSSWLPFEIAIAQSRVELHFATAVLGIYQSAVAGAVSLSLVNASSNVSVPVALGGVVWMSSSHLVAQPVAELTPGATYTLAVNASRTPTLLDSYVFSVDFFVIELVVSTSPTNAETLVALNRDFEVFFDQRMDASSLADRFHIWRADANLSAPADSLPGLLTLGGNGRVLRFNPTADFEDSLDYIARFEPGIATAGADGLAVITLPTALQTSFSAIPVAPRVIATVPSQSATGVAIGASLSILFDETMSRAATAAAITVWHGSPRLADGVQLNGTAAWNLAGTNVTFTPSALLPDDRTVFWSVSAAATDVPGNALANPSVYAFATVDLTAPALLLSSPHNGESAVAVAGSISLTFTEPMAQGPAATLAQSGCAGVALAAPIVKATSLSWNPAGTVATLTPSATLDADCTYQVALVPTLADVSGNVVSAATLAFVTACSESMHTADSADPLSSCVCNSGLVGPVHGPCAACPTNAECQGGTASPTALAGYYGLSSGEFVSCTPTAACGRNNTCNAGYTAAACSACASGYYRLSSRCAVCPSGQWLRWGALTVLALAASAAFLLGAVLLLKRAVGKGVSRHRRGISSRLAVISIAINFLQILAIMSQFQLGWPSNVLAVFDVFSVLNFNTDLLASECSQKLGFTSKFRLLTLLPVALGCFYGLLAAASYAVARSPCLRNRQISHLTRKHVACAVVALASFVYMMLAKASLQPFDCTRRSDGRWLLDADPSLFCFDPWWWALLPQAVIALVFYVVGIPALFLFIILRFGDRLEDSTSVGFACFGVVSTRYRPGHSWYEIVILLRKAAVLVAQMFVANSPPVQAMIAQCALLAALTVHLRTLPYNHAALNAVEAALLLAGLVVLLFGQVFYSTRSSALAALTIAVVVAACAAVVMVTVHALCMSRRGMDSEDSVESGGERSEDKSFESSDGGSDGEFGAKRHGAVERNDSAIVLSPVGEGGLDISTTFTASSVSSGSSSDGGADATTAMSPSGAASPPAMPMGGPMGPRRPGGLPRLRV